MNLAPLLAAALAHALCEFFPAYPQPDESLRTSGGRALARLSALLASCWVLELPLALWPLALALTIAHGIIDALSDPAAGLSGLLRDQALHALAIGLYAAAAGVEIDPRAGVALLRSSTSWIGVAGFLIAVFAGGTVVGRLVQPFAAALASALSEEAEGGLAHAGRLIGILERTLIFTSICLDFGELVGFVVAAKAILRFPETRGGSRELSEYYLVGTLASVSWAVGMAVITRWLMR